MITWSYHTAPYIESGEELYTDMILAYQNGAKYILVFNYPYDSSTYGILKEEHFEALRNFWNYVNYHPQTNDSLSEKVQYVLPKDYGYGFRGPNDRIWGFWEADALSNEICANLNSLLAQYGTRLDIIYDDGIEPGNTSEYNEFVFWNGTVTRMHAPKFTSETFYAAGFAWFYAALWITVMSDVVLTCVLAYFAMGRKKQQSTKPVFVGNGESQS
jgi:hypothetical protein